MRTKIYAFPKLLLSVLFCYASSFCGAEEVFNTLLEYPALDRIQQLTNPSMGFDKAGEAYFSPDGRTIIFQAVPSGQEHYQIYTMNLEEGLPVMVSTGRGACTCAFFRPDGQKIIFASSHEDPQLESRSNQLAISKTTQTGNYKWDLTPYMNIYEANPDGSSLAPLTTGPAYHAECAYSPDGSRIVYASNEDGSMNIYTMKSDGSDRYKITNTIGCYNGGPFYSPDGKRVIFRADRDRADYLQIYVIDSDGGNERQLTFNSAVNWAPFWHPNNQVVAFTTSLHGHRHYEIYLLHTETGHLCRLTHCAAFDGLPSFSTDGNKILWTSKRGPDQTSQVFIADFSLPEEFQ